MAKEPIDTGKKDNLGRKIWLLQVNTGIKVGGKYQRVTERFHAKTKKEAAARLREIESNLASGLNVNGGKVAFDQYAEAWLHDKTRTIAPRTAASYTREVERLCGILGNTPLDKINAAVVRATNDAVRDSISGRNGKPSEASVRACFKVLSLVLGQAEKDDLIRRNPCTKVDAPKAEMRERRALSREQYLDLLAKINAATDEAYTDYYAKESHLKDTGHQNKERHAVRGIKQAANLQAVRIAHATGMRPSEIFALQWKHIDFANGCIVVEQATQTANGGIKGTKTESGMRVLEIDPATMGALATWRRFQANAANSIGLELGLNSWVICSDSFTQTSHNNFTRWWNRWAESVGFGGWEFYELRHTQATLLIHAGGNLHSVKDRMGHSSIAVTEIYTHASRESQKQLVGLLPALN